MELPCSPHHHADDRIACVVCNPRVGVRGVDVALVAARDNCVAQLLMQAPGYDASKHISRYISARTEIIVRAFLETARTSSGARRVLDAVVDAHVQRLRAPCGQMGAGARAACDEDVWGGAHRIARVPMAWLRTPRAKQQTGGHFAYFLSPRRDMVWGRGCALRPDAQWYNVVTVQHA